MFSDSQGRHAGVFGVANKRAIAWSIATGLHAAGMKLAITYQNERLEQEAKDLILSLPGAEGYMCDVSKDEEIDRLFARSKSATASCTLWCTPSPTRQPTNLKATSSTPRAKA